ncbi:MAG: hypothetical protein QNJ84_11470 [Alphaproteobacteria bacterium]|nr:hypothetical protein [Alphaproteobacteria bacterium]
MHRTMTVKLVALAAALIVSLAGCGVTRSTGEIDSPIQRKLTWADFMSGGDLRRSCALSGGDRYRLVFNANRARQVRIYDVDFTRDSLRIRILQPNVIADIQLTLAGVKALTAPEQARAVLTPEQAARLQEAVRFDTDYTPQTAETRLLSEEWFWALSGCRDGQFVFRVWLNPEPSFRALTFPNMLFAADQTRVAVRAPPPDGPRPIKSGFTPERAASRKYYELFIQDQALVIGQGYGRTGNNR